MIKEFFSPLKGLSDNKEGLLFQFTLSAYLLTKEGIDALFWLCQELHQDDSFSAFKIKELLKLLTLLSRSACQCQPVSFSTLDTGSLAKLKNCCLLLASTCQETFSCQKQLKACAQELWFESQELLSVHLQLTTCSQLDMKSSELKPYLKAIEGTATKINKSISFLGELIIALAKRFQNDENVIFFLLCHRHKIDKAYETPMTKKLITYAKGNLQAVSSMLKEKYSKRGFDALVPIISEKIAELELSLGRVINS